jgi:hypothetical protein
VERLLDVAKHWTAARRIALADDLAVVAGRGGPETLTCVPIRTARE